jgi:hypothetical protein
MELWPSYRGTISIIWQPEGHILQKVLGFHSEFAKSFSYLGLLSNPVPFQISFSALKIVCFFMEPVTLHHV